MIATVQRKPLGQLLLTRGLLKQEQLDRALEEQKRTNHQKLLGGSSSSCASARKIRSPRR
jgi:hypothetical protein